MMSLTLQVVLPLMGTSPSSLLACSTHRAVHARQGGVHQPAISRMSRRALHGVCMHGMHRHTPL